MTPDQLWQTLVIISAVVAAAFGAAWRLSTVLEAVRGSVSALKLEVQQDVAQVRSDLALLRTSVDSKLAIAESQTKAEIVALKSATDRLAAEIAELRTGRPAPAPRRRLRGDA